MICPACGSELAALGVEGIVVDVCAAGCGGIWFDNFELCKVDEAHEKMCDALALLEFHREAVVVKKKRQCPRCFEITMLQHQFSREKPVLVDECPSCGGMWLDAGELLEIRRPASTKEDRRKATEHFFNKRFATELAELKARRAQQ
jgi:Zn-finger nucleic acid-binding protein